jgi:hypothetical protein
LKVLVLTWVLPAPTVCGDGKAEATNPIGNIVAEAMRGFAPCNSRYAGNRLTVSHANGTIFRADHVGSTPAASTYCAFPRVPVKATALDNRGACNPFPTTTESVYRSYQCGAPPQSWKSKKSKSLRGYIQ